MKTKAPLIDWKTVPEESQEKITKAFNKWLKESKEKDEIRAAGIGVLIWLFGEENLS